MVDYEHVGMLPDGLLHDMRRRIESATDAADLSSALYNEADLSQYRIPLQVAGGAIFSITMMNSRISIHAYQHRS